MRIVFLLLFLLGSIPAHHMEASMKSNALKEQPHSEIFRNLYWAGYNGNYVVSGEVKSSGGAFFYSVDNGHMEYIPEKKYALKNKPPVWKPFKIMITIPHTALPENGSVILNLYERNQKGKMVHSFPVILQHFY